MEDIDILPKDIITSTSLLSPFLVSWYVPFYFSSLRFPFFSLFAYTVLLAWSLFHYDDLFDSVLCSYSSLSVFDFLYRFDIYSQQYSVEWNTFNDIKRGLVIVLVVVFLICEGGNCNDLLFSCLWSFCCFVISCWFSVC